MHAIFFEYEKLKNPVSLWVCIATVCMWTTYYSYRVLYIGSSVQRKWEHWAQSSYLHVHKSMIYVAIVFPPFWRIIILILLPPGWNQCIEWVMTFLALPWDLSFCLCWCDAPFEYGLSYLLTWQQQITYQLRLSADTTTATLADHLHNHVYGVVVCVHTAFNSMYTYTNFTKLIHVILWVYISLQLVLFFFSWKFQDGSSLSLTVRQSMCWVIPSS